MAATTRKTTTRKTPARTPKVVPSKVIQLDRAENVKAFEAREPLFSIGGKEYSIPSEVPASIAMSVLERANEQGFPAAVDLALKRMVGQDGWDALKNCETLTAKDLGKVVDVVMAKVLPQEYLTPKAQSTDEPEN